MSRVVLNSTRGGLGDCVYLLWIAEGLRATGRNVAFTRGATDAIVTMFGHELTDQVGESLHDGHGYSGWELSVKGVRLDRTRLWQKRLGIDVEPKRPTPVIGAECADWAEAHWRAAAPNRDRALIFPYAHWRVRNWPINKWRRLGLTLQANGYGVLSSHTRQDELGAMPGAHVWGYGVEHVAALIQSADVVLGCGSGGTVLSSTMNIPTLAVLGPDDPDISYGFSPDNTLCITADKKAMPCRSCRYDMTVGWEKACDFGCEALQSITAEQVWKTMKQWSRLSPLTA